MPTFNSDQYGKFAGDPRQALNVNEWGGRMRVRYAKFSGAVGVAQNDFVRMFPIYSGERPIFFRVMSEANTAALTMDLGLEGGTENKYLSAVAINATPINSLLPSLTLAAETANGVVAMKFEGADPSDTADVDVFMFYVID